MRIKKQDFLQNAATASYAKQALLKICSLDEEKRIKKIRLNSCLPKITMCSTEAARKALVTMSNTAISGLLTERINQEENPDIRQYMQGTLQEINEMIEIHDAIAKLNVIIEKSPNRAFSLSQLKIIYSLTVMTEKKGVFPTGIWRMIL